MYIHIYIFIYLSIYLSIYLFVYLYQKSTWQEDDAIIQNGGTHISPYWALPSVLRFLDQIDINCTASAHFHRRTAQGPPWAVASRGSHTPDTPAAETGPTCVTGADSECRGPCRHAPIKSCEGSTRNINQPCKLSGLRLDQTVWMVYGHQ